jgi:hypothetical protein
LSAVSFPGSEISIRITTNPNPVEDMDEEEDEEEDVSPQISCRTSSVREQSNSLGKPPIPVRKHGPHYKNKFSTYSKPPPIPPHRNRSNLNEIKSMSVNARPPPVPPHREVKGQRPKRSSKSKSQVVAQKLKVDLPKNKPNWKNEANDKLDYNQLMEYFDNLKESNA